jgi:hypothetical protein
MGDAMRKLCALLGLATLPVVGAWAPAFAASKGGAPTRLVVLMKASQEVPTCDPATKAARGSAVFHITDATAGTVAYKLVAKGLPGDLTAAHIHQAPAGTPGSIVQPLDLNTGAKSGVIGRGTFTNPNLVAALESSPSDYYVNVHTSVCQSGVIRGQFAKGGSSS